MEEKPSPEELDLVKDWLESSLTENGDYRHRHVFESGEDQRERALEIIKKYIAWAHSDAKEKLEEDYNLGVNLDPESYEESSNVVEAYPQGLNERDLKGYFGEAVAGLLAEIFEVHRKSWVIPMFLFRLHNKVFERLEEWDLSDEPDEDLSPTPGRSGDDCLAFVLEDESVVNCMSIEAKYTPDHNSSQIDSAFDKVNEEPKSLLQIAGILDEIGEEELADQIRLFRYSDDDPGKYKMISYLHGKEPTQNDTWIDTDSPKKSTDDEAVELESQVEVAEALVSKIGEIRSEVYRYIGEEL